MFLFPFFWGPPRGDGPEVATTPTPLSHIGGPCGVMAGGQAKLYLGTTSSIHHRFGCGVRLHPPPSARGGPPKKGNKEINKENKIIFSNFCRGRFSSKTWSGLNFGLLGPENSDSSSKTTYMVLFPGSNSPIQVKIH